MSNVKIVVCTTSYQEHLDYCRKLSLDVKSVRNVKTLNQVYGLENIDLVLLKGSNNVTNFVIKKLREKSIRVIDLTS